MHTMKMVWISIAFTAAAGLLRLTWALSPDPWALGALAGTLFFALYGALLLRKLLWETAP